MADWTNITDTQVDPDAPLTSELAYAWRDNPIAIAEGAAGAPRIRDAAMGTTVTAAGSAWVRLRIAAGLVNQVGTFVIAFTGTGSTQSYGDTVSGSSLTPASVGGVGDGSVSLTGTWMCLGYSDGSVTTQQRTTLWVKVA